MKTKIIVDSAANMLPGQLGDCQLEVVPLYLIQEDTTWTDDESFDSVKFNKNAEKGMKTTSACPSISSWMKAYEGGDEIFVITISKKLSGSYNSAVQAANLYQEEHPEVKIYVFDSYGAGPVQRLGAKKIAELKEQGLAFLEIVGEVNDYFENHLKTFFALKSVINLVNNGRLNPVVGKMLGMLKIWVYGWADEGLIEPLGKARGDKKALASVVAKCKETGYCGGRVEIDHVHNLETASDLHDLYKKEYPKSKVGIDTCKGLCSFYAEEGGLMIGIEI